MTKIIQTASKAKTPEKIAFQGWPGAYSDLACREVFPNMETLPCATFEDAFRALRDETNGQERAAGRADLAMIPIDNTLAGRVADVHHLMPSGGLYIIGEHFQPIQHSLLGVRGTKKEQLKHVHSHVHALPQCRKVIREMNLSAHVHADTAGAAKEVARRNDKAHAAIASSLAGQIYGLDVIEPDIQDADHNTTRFLILSRDHLIPDYEEDRPFITSFLFRVRNIPAALYKALGGFATNRVNMLKLESYVDQHFQIAQFYADVLGHPETESLRLALEELAFFSDELTILGTYPAHEFRNIKGTK